MIAAVLTAQLAAPMAALAADKGYMTHSGDTLLFDFGAAAEDGWIKAGAETKYTAERGYGFTMVSFVTDVPAGGSGVLSDAVRISWHERKKTAFRIDLPDGVYEFALYSGDISYMNVTVDGYPAILDLAARSSEARVEVAVTGGSIEVGLDRGASGMELAAAALTVTRRSGIADRRPRIFVLGDSTAAARYPLFLPQPFEESWPGGWGQMLGAYLPEYYVHNISAGGRGTREQLAALSGSLHFAKDGDYVIIALGINDFGAIAEDEYRENLKKIIAAVRGMGCVPVVMSDAATLREYKDGAFGDMCYANAARAAAEEAGAAFYDLHAAHAEYLAALGGGEEMFLLYNGVRDQLHPNRGGAGQLARLVYEGFIALTGSGAEWDVSDTPLFKCRIRDKNTLEIINTAPYETRAALISPVYVSGKCEQVRSAAVTLPAYDPLLPEQTVSAELSGFDPGSGIYLISGSGTAEISYDERIRKR